MVKPWVPFLVTAAFAFQAEASNGRVALAFPVEGIVVNGDLSDWPAETRVYPITFLEYGVPPRDPSDFEANLRVGYDARENALYVAVEVRDESAVIDTTAGRFWNTQDGAEVYLELSPGEQDAPVVQYVIWGTDPGVWGSPGVLARRQSGDVVSAVKRHGGYQRYEWRVDAGRLTRGEAHLRPGVAIGFDVAVCDLDADGSFSWMAFGPGRRKFWVGDPSNAEARGDLVLVEAGRGAGKLDGRLTWEDSGEGVKYGRLRVESLSDPGVTVEVRADREGRYAVEMPSGRYRVAPVIGRGGKITPTVNLVAGRDRNLDLRVKPPVGQVRDAGPGKKPWRRFSIPDGLPATVISAMLQDRRGDLWFGTPGDGVSRYDGEKLTTVGQKDGLASNQVRCMLEDRDGNLWFGTGRAGVSRYDGVSFTSFTTKDGLASDEVGLMLEDRDGNLWFAGTGPAVTRYADGRFTRVAAPEVPNESVNALCQDRQGTVWLGTWRNGLMRYDGQSFQRFAPADSATYNNVTCMLVDRAGILWIGTAWGVVRYDGRHSTAYNTAHGLPHNNVMCIFEDRDGRLWVGTQAGVCHLEGQAFVAEPSLPADAVSGILQDREGLYWFGTAGNGLVRYDRQQLVTFGMADGLPNDRVFSVQEDRQGNLWFGTQGGGREPVRWEALHLLHHRGWLAPQHRDQHP